MNTAKSKLSKSGSWYNRAMFWKKNEGESEPEPEPSKDPYDLLPVGIWKAILNMLENSSDKSNLIISHPQFITCFRSLLPPEVTFCRIFDIFLKYYEENGKKWMDDLELVKFNERIRSLRTLSSRCCKYFDKYIEECWQKTGHGPSFTYCSYKFDEEGKVDDFLEKMGSHSPMRVPLIGRTVTALCSLANRKKYSNPPNPEEINHENLPRGEEMLELIRISKNKLRILDLTIVVTGHAHRALNFIMDVINSVPTIHILKLNLLTEEGTAKIEVSQEIKKKIELPEMPNLEELHLICKRSAIPIAECLPIKQYLPQLCCLQLHYSLWKKDYVKAGLLPKLEQMLFLVIPNEEAEEEIYHLFRLLDAPKLKSVIYRWQSAVNKTDSSLTAAEEKSAYFIVKSMKYATKERKPSAEWVPL